MRIYFAAPFLNMAVPKAGSDYGWTPDNYNNWLKKIIDAVEATGHKVRSPHRDDHQWGKIFPKIEDLSLVQYDKITKESDLLLAYIGAPQSGGVCIEIGYAISHKVPVIIIKKPEEKITLIAYGLDSIGKCEILEFTNDEDLIQKLKGRLTKY